MARIYDYLNDAQRNEKIHGSRLNDDLDNALAAAAAAQTDADAALAQHPATSTDNAIARYDGTAGTLQGSLATVGDAGTVSAPALRISSATGGMGYTSGAGGTVTQQTSKSTGVTLNTVTGKITMNNEEIVAGGVKAFVFTNSALTSDDVIVVGHNSGGTVGSYNVYAFGSNGQAVIRVENNTGGNLSEAIVILFVVIKGADD